MNSADQTEQGISQLPNARSALFAKVSAIAIATLLVAAPSSAFAQAPSAEGADSAGGGEIVVTAQRREQGVLDIPYNITAVSGDSLATAGAVNANDLTKVVAGLGNFNDGPSDRFGENNFSMRGLRTDPAGPNNAIKYSVSSVSTYYGDVPVNFSLLLKDLDRVEVLRGPQGTLYGSGAQSGAIRFIPNRPTFDRVSGEVNASTGITKKAGSLNYSVDGVINLPLAENLALRVTGAYVRQAGFIDQVNLFERDQDGVPVPAIPGNPFSGPAIAPIEEDTNSWTQWMGRAALRYEPTDWLDLEVAYLHQETDSKDAQVVNPAYQGGTRDLSSGFFPDAEYDTRPGGRYRNTRPALEPVKAKLDLVSGTAAFDIGFAELTSISAYYNNRVNSVTDLGNYYISPFGNFAVGYNHYPRFSGPGIFDGGDKGFTQEVRLVSQGNSPLSYVLGLYYQRLKKDADYTFIIPGVYDFADAYCATGAPDCVPGANPQLGDIGYAANQDFVNKEKAAFGELTYQLTPEWQVTGGIRVFKNTQTFDTYQRYTFFGAPFGDGVTEPVSQGASLRSAVASSSKTVFKANTSYDIDPDNKIYFTFAQGYRRGGANPLATTGPTASLPEFGSFSPDIANNYEIGIKGRVLDRRLRYALSLFRIDLNDFQFFGLTPSGFTAIFNGEKATSEGLEFEGSLRATPELTLSMSYAYTSTDVPVSTIIRDLRSRTLVDDPQPVIVDNPGATVLKGSVLPGVSKHSLTGAVDYEVFMGGGSKLHFHLNGSYRTKQNNVIATGSPIFAVLPAVFTADARITYDSGKGWAGSVFVTNLTDAFNSTGTAGAQSQATSDPQSLIYAGKIIGTPRTFGVSLHYGF